MGAKQKKRKNENIENKDLHLVNSTESTTIHAGGLGESKLLRWLKEWGGGISVIVVLVSAAVTYGSFSEKIDILGEDVATVQHDIKAMQGPLIKLWYDESGEMLDIATTELFVLDATKSDFVASLVDVNTYEVSDISRYAQKPETVYMYDVDGKQHTLSDIENSAIMVPYYEEGKLVIFYGFINANGHWDKECVLNVYENEELVLSSVDQYDDGVSNCKMVCFIDGVECSFIQSCGESSDVFDCYRYTLKEHSIPQPSFDSLSEEVLVLPQDYSEKIQGDMLHYYHGGIMNELYSDDSGKAYYISYYPDGTVKTLYNGYFKDGEFEDETGRAWYITQDRDNNTDYMYYRGTFRNGTASTIENERIESENPVTKDTILFLVNGRPYEDALQWDYSKVAK